VALEYIRQNFSCCLEPRAKPHGSLRQARPAAKTNTAKWIHIAISTNTPVA
jgi:hypothetical protein